MPYRYREVAPNEVHSVLRRHMLVDGYPIVVDFNKSRHSWVHDAVSGQDYLDFFSFFASNPLGFNHSSMLDEAVQRRLARVATTKVSNSDYYTTFMAEFVDTLSQAAAPAGFPHFFFVDGGSLAVENAMKVAFDWKVQKNIEQGRGELGSQILHFEGAFHGRSGYTLSVTNTDPVKTRYFPKFDWPRVPAPALRFPIDANSLAQAEEAERKSIAAIERAFDERPHDIAAILIEPIQGEGGDQHFRPEFFRELRRIADEREAMLIYDEVQTGLGLTGQWWAFQHHGFAPDILCFAKKMQVGGIFVSLRVDEVPNNVFVMPSRINSTWGASLVDMVRCTHILETITNEGLVENAANRGAELLSELVRIAGRFDDVTNPRGKGLMCAIDLPSPELRNALVRRCFENNMIVLSSGVRSLRFRPTLTVNTEAVMEGARRLEQSLEDIKTR